MTPGGEKLSCAKDKESRNDVWFKFQASSEQVEVEVIPYGTTPISKIAVGLYDDQGNEITCARHFSDSLPVKVAYQALTVGNWYYLRVDNANKRAGDFNLCVKNEISYDFQAGAITVSHTGLWCSPDGAYTTTGMTPEGKKISCSKDKKSRNDVWFKFRASSEQVELEVVPTGATPIGRIVAGIYDESLAELVCASYTADNLPVSISHNDLNLGSWYYIRVDNHDQYQGDFRLCVSGGEVIPDAPSTLAVDFDISGLVKLSWADNSDNEQGFIIERSVNNAAFEVLDSVSADVTSYEDNLIVNGQSYTYRVSAQNYTGASSFSNVDFAIAESGSTINSIIDNYDAVLYVNQNGNDTYAVTNDLTKPWVLPHIASVKAHTLSQTDNLKYLPVFVTFSVSICNYL